MDIFLPWVDVMLENIKEEYKKHSLRYKITGPSKEDLAYIRSVLSKPSGFESDKFIREVLEADPEIKKVSVEDESTLLLVDCNEIDLEEWVRSIRLLSKDPIRVVVFGHKAKRMMPDKGGIIEKKHVNGGYTIPCDGKSIIIYREEEALRVFIHELLHASCTDPKIAIPLLEAETEAWAEIVLCGLMAKGQKGRWEVCMKKQIQYAIEQANTVMKDHVVRSEADYAWRYIVGRIDVWRKLGIHVEYSTMVTENRSLKFTAK
jgi:hypothetical protein